MRVTTWTEYSLIISLHLARRGRAGNGPVAARELAEETGLKGAVGEIAGIVERIGEGFHYVIVDLWAEGHGEAG